MHENVIYHKNFALELGGRVPESIYTGVHMVPLKAAYFKSVLSVY